MSNKTIATIKILSFREYKNIPKVVDKNNEYCKIFIIKFNIYISIKKCFNAKQLLLIKIPY